MGWKFEKPEWVRRGLRGKGQCSPVFPTLNLQALSSCITERQLCSV